MADPATEPANVTGRPVSSSRDGSRARLGVVVTVVAVLAGVLAADQVVKRLVVDWLGPEAATHRQDVIGSWLAFEYVENTGAAFGILAGRTWLLSVAAVLIVSWFVWAYGRSLPGFWMMQVAVGLVLGGAIGNLVDRIRLGYVVDFIAVGTWPRFNVADSAITIGLVLLFISAFREEAVGSGQE
jgi:signal peptidase II